LYGIIGMASGFQGHNRTSPESVDCLQVDPFAPTPWLSMFLALAVLGTLAPKAASAQSGRDTCALVGIFDAKARRLCEAAAKAAPSSNTFGSAPAEAREPNPSNQPETTAYTQVQQAPSPPAKGSQRIEIAGSALTLDMVGTYPDGYTANWALTSKAGTTIMVDTYIVQPSQNVFRGQTPMFIRLFEDQGRPTIEFSLQYRRIDRCLADLSGPITNLSSRPTRFSLANLRFTDSRGAQCSNVLRAQPQIQGWVALSKAGTSDIIMDLSIDVSPNRPRDNGYAFSVRGIRFENQLTPQMAALAESRRAAEAETREIQAAQQAKAAEAARKAEQAEAQRQEDLLNSLPPIRSKPK
jgi:hypothetical protein